MNPNEMSESELRIKVAELCGYSDFGKQAVNLVYDQLVMWDEKTQKHIPVPDYPNDLNACHEFEKMLNGAQRGRYGHYLSSGLSRAAGNTGEYDIWHATATQKCLAFVATMQPVSEVSQDSTAKKEKSL